MNSFWCSKSMTNILIICWKCIVIKHAKISKLFYSKINSFLFCFLLHFWKYPHARRHMLINYITGPPAFRSFSNPVHLRQLLRPALITKLEHASLGLSKLSVYHKVSVASLKVLVLWAKEEGWQESGFKWRVDAMWSSMFLSFAHMTKNTIVHLSCYPIKHYCIKSSQYNS